MDEFQPYNERCHKAFRKAMDECRADAERLGFDAAMICTPLIVAAIRCAALAIVGADAKDEDFDGMLEMEVARIRAKAKQRSNPS